MENKASSAENISWSEKRASSTPGEVNTIDSDRTTPASDQVFSATASQILRGWRLPVVQTCLLFCLGLSVLDSTIIATALVTIGNDFDDYLTLQWVVLAYLVAYVVFILVLARVSDILGRKWTTVASLTILAIGSLGAGLSQTLTQVIVFRGIQGIGGAGLYSMPMIAILDITPPEGYALMSGFMGLTFAIAAVLGPTIGGVIATHTTWRWVFFFNLPCCGVIVALLLFSWPHTPTPGAIKLRQLDVVGSVLVTAAVVLVCFALQEGGSGIYAWNSAAIVCTLVFAAVSFIAFGIWTTILSVRQRNNRSGRIAMLPLFPVRIVSDRIRLMTIFVTALTGYTFYTVLVEMPQRFQIVDGRSAQAAGIDLLPVSATSAVGSMAAGIISSKHNRSFPLLVLGCALMLVGTGIGYSIPPNTTVLPAIYGYQVPIGLGFGMCMSSSTILMKVNSAPKDAAAAQGLMGQCRALGGNIGLAVATIITSSHLSSGLRDVLTAAQISDLQQSLNVITTFTPTEQKAVADVFARGFVTQMEVCTIVAAVAVVACALIWERHPRTYENEVRDEDVL